MTTAVGALFPVGIKLGRKKMKKFNGTPHSSHSKPKNKGTRVKPRPAGADYLKAGKTK
tara:strand:- start:257 stop:430 length:174 start_codon:yes stop_codon:yes gene_type:complete